VTTPEGFRFMYKNFDKDQEPLDNSELIRGSTYDNERNLQPGYIENLKRVYPAKLLEAYLNGAFVNMTSGCVYDVFDRDIHCSSATLQQSEPVHIGMDFNVRNMHATVHVIRAGKLIAIDELVKIKDTPTIISIIKQRYAGHKILIYPDASNPGSTLNASLSDIGLLKSAGLTVIANSGNPRVKDRILSLYTGIEKGRYVVNVSRCPTLALSLENQVYDKNGVPDKKDGFDHILDATGYFVVKAMPIKAPRWKGRSRTIHTM